ncbi:pilus assembly protein TadG-related protein [uncultured Brevundimonas sp.]|uniref:pilus assembly protein TadG-related protein n=1 Tax=uncultured Brevundimonas sp. TaxID=213418 RepID=UPI00344F2682
MSPFPELLWQDRRGGIATMAAVGSALACLLTAVVIDGGSIALAARRAQSAADLGALAAARDIANAERAAIATTYANVGADVLIQTATGTYVPDTSVPPDRRFNSAGESKNAAQVTVTMPAEVWFTRWILGKDRVQVTRTGTAAVRSVDPMATFSIGSRLAALDGGLANQVLSGLTGSQVALSVMDYRALADVDVDLLGFTDALATHTGVAVGDYDRLLDQRVDAGDALRILETLTTGADSGLNRLARAADGQTFRIGELIGAETGAEQGLRGGLEVGVSALDLANAMIELSGGDRQVALDLGAKAGLSDLDVWLAIGERPNRSPWMAVAKNGQPVIRTAQARLYIEAKTAQNLSGLAQVKLPLLVELASSEARLEQIDCEEGRSVRVAVRPGVARARIGTTNRSTLDDFKTAAVVQPASLVNVAGLVVIKASADIEAADKRFKSVTFSDAQIANQTAQTVKSTGFTSSLVSSLLGRMQLDVKVVGLGLGLGNLTQALGTLLSPLGPVLDGVVTGVLDSLGLSFGEADVVVHGATCPVNEGAAYLVG